MKTKRQFLRKTCFMFAVCFSLFMGVTSCSSDDFEGYGPEPKKMTDAELVEWALAQMPQSRAPLPTPVIMVTTKQTGARIEIKATDNIEINWGDNTPPTTVIGDNTYRIYYHDYSDNLPAHTIYLTGSNQVITDLYLDANELIYLDITNNTELKLLTCQNNRLNLLHLTGCSNLEFLTAHQNELSFIDVTNLPKLVTLHLYNNRLLSIDLSANLSLVNLLIGDNPLTSLDLTNNPHLRTLYINNLDIYYINNRPTTSTSLSIFTQLQHLNISNTPFIQIDLSNNPVLSILEIDRTAITQLDVSANTFLTRLNAANSNLQDIICSQSSLLNLHSVNLINTPLENNQQYLLNFMRFVGSLPDRNNPLPAFGGSIQQGWIYTNSPFILGFSQSLAMFNWVIYLY